MCLCSVLCPGWVLETMSTYLNPKSCLRPSYHLCVLCAFQGSVESASGPPWAWEGEHTELSVLTLCSQFIVLCLNSARTAEVSGVSYHWVKYRYMQALLSPGSRKKPSTWHTAGEWGSIKWAWPCFQGGDQHSETNKNVLSYNTVWQNSSTCGLRSDFRGWYRSILAMKWKGWGCPPPSPSLTLQSVSLGIGFLTSVKEFWVKNQCIAL